MAAVFVIVTLPVEPDKLIPVPAVNPVTPVLAIVMSAESVFVTLIPVPELIKTVDGLPTVGVNVIPEPVKDEVALIAYDAPGLGVAHTTLPEPSLVKS